MPSVSVAHQLLQRTELGMATGVLVGSVTRTQLGT